MKFYIVVEYPCPTNCYFGRDAHSYKLFGVEKPCEYCDGEGSIEKRIDLNDIPDELKVDIENLIEHLKYD